MILKAYAFICGYRSDTGVIYAEETLYLLQLKIPTNVLDEDDYRWTKAEMLLSKKAEAIDSFRTFSFDSGKTVTGKLFWKELRQISNADIKLKKANSTVFEISKFFMQFQSEMDFDDYLLANEPDNPNHILDIKMSNFFPALSLNEVG